MGEVFNFFFVNNYNNSKGRVINLFVSCYRVYRKLVMYIIFFCIYLFIGRKEVENFVYI